MTGVTMSIRVKPQPTQTVSKRDDRYDEVWEGITVMSPMANLEHMSIINDIGVCLNFTVNKLAGDFVHPGCNVSDRNLGWEKNYCVPDTAVILANGNAIYRGTHWEGGPDFLIEILSPGDRALQKLPFYASINTREVLIIDRDPWQLSLYQLQQQQLQLVGASDTTASQVITSSVLPLTFQLIQGATRPTIVMTHAQTQQQWQA